jgi:hypothetical protein
MVKAASQYGFLHLVADPEKGPFFTYYLSMLFASL